MTAWKNKDITRISFNIETETYQKIKASFYHGQFTQFVRQMILSLDRLIDTDKVSEIVQYLNDETDLTLPAKRKEK